MSTGTARAEANGRAWLAEIVERYGEWLAATPDGEYSDAAEAVDEWARESALSVEVRSGWYSLPGDDVDRLPAEFCVMLSTGGPACRVVGGLDEYGEAGGAMDALALEVQDWGTPWAPLSLTDAELDAVAWFAGRFYFGG